jgi:hypothetical protein
MTISTVHAEGAGYGVGGRRRVGGHYVETEEDERALRATERAWFISVLESIGRWTQAELESWARWPNGLGPLAQAELERRKALGDPPEFDPWAPRADQSFVVWAMLDLFARLIGDW